MPEQPRDATTDLPSVVRLARALANGPSPPGSGVPAPAVTRAPSRAPSSLPMSPTTPVSPDPASPPVDHAVVREVRTAVAAALATQLQRHPGLSAAARQELGRHLLTTDLAARARARIAAGEPPWTANEEFAVATAAMAALFGLGRLQPLVDDPRIENIEINGHDQVWVSYADGREAPGPSVADSDEELIELLQLLAARTVGNERSFTTASPTLHVRLDDGSRLAAVAWTTPRPQVVIRRHRVRDVDLDDLIELGTVDPCLAGFLRAALRAGKNIIVTGLQNAGKTTLIRALANEFPPLERFATIEREYELHLHELPDRHPRLVPLEAREGSSERDAGGRRAGEVTMTHLVRTALRMNLRRIIVGEVRGEEVLPMLEAMTTGDGSLCTLHARTAGHAIDRLVTLCMHAGIGISDAFAYRLVAQAVDLVVHVSLLDETAIGGGRHRYVSQVLEINGIGELNRPAVTTVFGPGPDGRAAPAHRPTCLDDLVRVGFDPSLLNQPHGLWPTRLDRLDQQCEVRR